MFKEFGKKAFVWKAIYKRGAESFIKYYKFSNLLSRKMMKKR
jgi:hypothetical protein